MRWICPHCKTELSTPELGQGAAITCPKPGWAYARCEQCHGFATVELSTGNASPVNPKQATSTIVKGQLSAFETDNTIQNAIVAGPPTELTPESIPTPRNLTPTKIKASVTIALFLIGSTGYLLLHTLQKTPAPTQAHVAKTTPPQNATQLERAHRAATKLAAKLGAVPPQLSTMTNSAPQEQPQIASAADIHDSIQSSAMAPIRPQKTAEVPLYLQARRGIKALEIRSGPDNKSPLIGLADLDERYSVLEWKNRWFRIKLEDSPSQVAWVRYEAVELFSRDGENGENKP